MKSNPEWRTTRIQGLNPDEFCVLLSPLLDDSIAHGFNMLLRLVSEYRSETNRFDQAGEALFGILSRENKLLAVGGLNRNPYTDEPSTGRVRRVYVHSAFRRLGLGAAITNAVMVEAKALGYPALVLRAPESAFEFYESQGFERVLDVEPITHRKEM